MDIDPNVQVALVSVFATLITTLGVIAVAVINNRKERAKAAGAGVEAGLDERDVLTRILSLIAENDDKDEKLKEAQLEILRVSEDNRQLRAENTVLRLSQHTRDPDGSADV